MSNEICWGGRLVRVEHLGSESSLTLGETSSGSGSAVGEFDMGIESHLFQL